MVDAADQNLGRLATKI
ncbi:MAG TPA: hypothetical protein PK954_21445, partial [Anaerolineales bacterium]|nr:hypothetical protein [Anaerolineales bacterium]